MMPPRTDIQLWIDLEATGSGDDEEIVEVGLSLVETENWTEMGSYSHLVEPSKAAWARMEANAAVMRLHNSNGLYDDLVRMREMQPGRYTIDYIDGEVEQWIKSYVGSNTTHIPLGGSGVLHYDRKFIKRDMPRLDQRLTYWALDVGVPRRHFQIFGIPWLAADDGGGKTHRALDDARYHFREFMFFRDFLLKATGK